MSHRHSHHDGMQLCGLALKRRLRSKGRQCRERPITGSRNHVSKYLCVLSLNLVLELASRHATHRVGPHGDNIDSKELRNTHSHESKYDLNTRQRSLISQGWLTCPVPVCMRVARMV